VSKRRLEEERERVCCVREKDIERGRERWIIKKDNRKREGEGDIYLERDIISKRRRLNKTECESKVAKPTPILANKSGRLSIEG
jgi:hypothetical protein